MEKQIAVLGLGNILCRDDGVGVHLVNSLLSAGLPSSVHLVDAGVNTLDSLVYFEDYQQVVILDALKGGLAPGTLYKLKADDIKDYDKNNLSLHDVQILDLVEMAARLDKHPRVLIYGVEPKDTSLGMEMTPELQSSMEGLVDHIRQELFALVVEFQNSQNVVQA